MERAPGLPSQIPASKKKWMHPLTENGSERPYYFGMPGDPKATKGADFRRELTHWDNSARHAADENAPSKKSVPRASATPRPASAKAGNCRRSITGPAHAAVTRPRSARCRNARGEPSCPPGLSRDLSSLSLHAGSCSRPTSPSRPPSPLTLRKSLAQQDLNTSLGWKFTDFSPSEAKTGRKARKCECGMVRPTFGASPDEDISAARWCEMCPDKPKDAVCLEPRHCLCGKSKPRYAVIMHDGKLDIRWCALCPSKPKDAVNAKAILVKRAGGRELAKPTIRSSSRKAHAPPEITPGIALFCSICAPPDAVAVSFKLCKCRNHRPTHAMPGQKMEDAKWCHECPSKPKRAVDVVSNQCICKHGFPRFGLPTVQPKSMPTQFTTA